jgi:flagellar hook-length control protein FliK
VSGRAGAREKNPAISRTSIRHGACDGFCRINIGLPFVRAAATSKIASPASLPASQANGNANKADPTSPFALLVNDAAKPAAKPAHADKSDDHKTGQQDDDQQATRAASTHALTQPSRRASSDKTDKTAKNDKADKSDQTQDAAAQTNTAADATTGKVEARADTKTDAQNETTAADGSQLSCDPQLADKQGLPVAQGPAPQPGVTVTPGQDGTVGVSATAGASAAATQTAQNAAAQSDDTDSLEDVAAQGASAAAGKPGAPKTKTSPIADAQADAKTAAADNRTADIKADASQAQTQAQADKAAATADAATPPDVKPAPQPVQAANTNTAITAPQGAQVTATTVTKHVQVAQAASNTAPNLPALAVQIAAKSQSGSKQFDIRLDPPELGRVEVRLSIDSTGKASAHLSADQPQTLDLLQKDAPSLMRALRDAGLDVSQDGLNFSLRQQGGDSSNAGSNGARGNARGSFSLSATTSIEATATSAAYRGPANGRLDISV